MKASEQFISFIIPVHNEEGNVELLHKEVVDVIRKNNYKAEIIFVDDGSTDDTLSKLRTLAPVKIIVFRKNFMQTAAFDAGIKAASGDILVTMDGDLQNDPADVPKLLSKIDEGLDVVSGWRKDRRDPFSKKFLSRGADFLRKRLINDQINDSGCSLKAYRAECFDGVRLYGEMHRFIPAILKIKGYRIGEVIVRHRPRRSGQTKYNYRRLVKGLLDLLSIWFWQKFSNRPMHLFGGLGAFLGFIGSLIMVWMFIEKVIFGVAIGNRIWPLMGVLLIILGIQFFISGLTMDISVKTYYQTNKEDAYSIREIIENN